VESPSATNGNKTITTTTTYVSGFVYESKTTVPANTPNDDYTDVLQFMPQEEGRIRFKPAVLNSSGVVITPASFQYDYFIKDHLGNVRMVLTEEQQTNYYPAVTLEGTYGAGANSMVNYEASIYRIDNTKIIAESAIASWVSPAETLANTKLYYNNNSSPSSNVAPVTPPNLSYPAGCTPTQIAGSGNLYKLNATTNKTGLEFMIKVMAGDKIDIFGKSYFLNTATVNNTNSTPLDLLGLMTNMLLSPANAAAGKGVSAATLSTINTGVLPTSFFRGSNGETTTIPKAYINYIFFDEQFKYAGGGASRVGSSGLVKDHWYVDAAQLQNISAPKNGYIFVYVSNESNLDVFFDNLQVVHKPGPILEETHYYPFGLTMAGISSKAAGKLENKKKFNGYELNTDFDINLNESFYRSHDPQLGRFWQIDPSPTFEISPYVAMGNNPISLNDLLGDTSIYYNSQGAQIGAINRGSGVTAVEVGDNWSGVVGLAIGAINGNKDLSDKQVGAFDALLQGTGTAYDISGMSKYYAENGNKNSIEQIDGTPVSAMKSFTINGKSADPKSLKAEASVSLIMKDGKITVGNREYKNKDLVRTYAPDNMGTEAGYTGAFLHTHPAMKDSKIEWKSGFSRPTYNIYPGDGPSGADYQKARGDAQYNNGVRNVVADKNYIYLINGTDKQTIKIPR
jgi:RHS repeat-associated protein